jgi:ribosome-binding ATPase YchF (GTP1/OBG family)
MLADLSMIDRRLERLHAGGGRHGTPAEREANEHEARILLGLKAALEAGRPIRDETMDPDDEKAIRGFRFLTQKPVLVLLNVGEGDLPSEPALVERIAAGYPHSHALVDALSAKIEMELGELEPDEAAVFMEELGLAESSLDRVIALSYRLVGLISFLTAGPDEVAPAVPTVHAVDARARFTPTSPGDSSEPRRSAGRSCSPRGRSQKPSATARSAPRARPTGCATVT